jgi:hypothetical protein
MKLRKGRAGKLGGALAGAVVAVALVSPSSALGASKFGAKLSKVVDPVGASPPHQCLPAAGGCTRAGVAYAHTGAVGGNVQAPESGKIKRIRLIAADPGNFRFFLLKLRNLDLTTGTGLARAKRKGPRIEYDGTGFTSKPIEHFKVGVKVKRGEFLAIKSRKTSALDCTQTTPQQLVYQPPLGLGGGFVASRAFDTCQLLVQAVVK